MDPQARRWFVPITFSCLYYAGNCSQITETLVNIVKDYEDEIRDEATQYHLICRTNCFQKMGPRSSQNAQDHGKWALNMDRNNLWPLSQIWIDAKASADTIFDLLAMAIA